MDLDFALSDILDLLNTTEHLLRGYVPAMNLINKSQPTTTSPAVSQSRSNSSMESLMFHEFSKVLYLFVQNVNTSMKYAGLNEVTTNQAE
jgi:hypothetical protein